MVVAEVTLPVVGVVAVAIPFPITVFPVKAAVVNVFLAVEGVFPIKVAVIHVLPANQRLDRK
jgi:hypothetical protein